MPGSRIGVGERARAPTSRSRCGRSDAQDLPCGATGRIVEELAELGESQLDEADEALADTGLLGDERHREAGRLAQSGTGERVAGGRLFAHGHEGEAPRIGRIGLGAAQLTLGKVLRPKLVDEGHRDALSLEMCHEWHPIVARGLHRHEIHGLGLSREPVVEAIEAGVVLAHPQDLAVGLRPSFAAARHHMLLAPDIDADGHHRYASFRPPGVPSPSRSTSTDGSDHRSRSCRWIPITVHGRGSGAVI